MAGEITLSKEPGKSMRKWREIFGVTQIELAEHLGISSSTISDYEGGRPHSPGIGVIKRLISSLIEIDKKRGSQIGKKLEGELVEEVKPYTLHEFFESVPAEEFLKKVKAKVVSGKGRVQDSKIFGYTMIDSVKAIVEVPVQDYLHIFGKTPNRALIFSNVSTGRSPLIAVKIGKFSVDMKPSLIILHGIEQVDELAVKIAEAEKIPLAITSTPMNEIVESLKEFEVQ